MEPAKAASITTFLTNPEKKIPLSEKFPFLLICL
jgi:hypothetical protein